jgi:LCP family protein required for cell wall assembly
MVLNVKLDDQKFENFNAQKKPKKLKGPLIIALIIILIITGIVFGCLHFTNRFGIEFKPTELFKSNPELKKDSTGTYTNVMLIGIDTRDGRAGLRNTDSIMLISYNHNTNNVVLISIPRDFYVEVPDQGWYTKINAIYSISENREKDSGLETLQSVVEEVLNVEIQYYGMADLSGFTQIVDQLGGIKVDVENPFTDYRYPVEGRESVYQTISFESGPQIMDGITALRYVRSRHSPHHGEGSDFARARRQQRVLIGVKEKLLSSETLLNPVKVFEILNILEKNVKYSKLTNQDIQAANKVFRNDGITTYTFVLDPSIADYKLVTDRGVSYNAYAVGPLAGLGRYEEIHKYFEYALKEPAIYSKNPSILVYDIGLGYNEAVEKTQEFQEKFPYIKISFGGTLMTERDGSFVFNNTAEHSLENILAKRMKIDRVEKPEFVETLNLNGEYVILLGLRSQSNLDELNSTSND